MCRRAPATPPHAICSVVDLLGRGYFKFWAEGGMKMKRANETRNEKPVIELVKIRRRAELQFVTR